MQYSKLLKSRLNDNIVDVAMTSDFIRNPKSDFTRKRKLDFITTFNSILSMGGTSLDREMLDLFNFSESTPTKSAFVQSRNKILPEAFSHVFSEFSNSLRKPKKFRGYNLLAVDGSRLNIFHNAVDSETHVERKNGKGHNVLVLSAMYDLNNHIYTDAIIQPIRLMNERSALIDMLPNVSDKSIVILDRGYESYNVFAHIESIKSNYVTRVKDIHSNGILSGFNLPDTEFDMTFTVDITNYQRKVYKSLPNYRFSPSTSRFDFSNTENPVYSLSFRVVRIRLNDGRYECLATNLSNEFSSDDLKHLYKLRWGIETSFRELKYSVGLVNFHAKKKDSIIQEIFARLTLHNFCKSIVQNTILMNRDNTHNYQINFVMAVHVCRQFLRLYNTISFNIEALISRYLSITREHRSFVRNIKAQSYKSFIYRVS